MCTYVACTMTMCVVIIYELKIASPAIDKYIYINKCAQWAMI